MATFPPKPRIPVINWGHPITKGLVLDMPLFEGGRPNVIDVAGKKKGTFTSSPQFVIDLYGYSVSFNGSSDFITHSGTGLLLTVGQKFIFQAIFKTSGTAGQIMGVRQGDPTASGRMTEFQVSSTGKASLRHDHLANPAANTVSSATSVNDNKWHNCIGTYDGVNLRVYVDGKVDGVSGTLTNLSLTTTNTWAIGRRSDFAAEYFSGRIALVRMWKNKILTNNEISKLTADPFCIYNKIQADF